MNTLSFTVLFVAIAAASAGHWGGDWKEVVIAGPSNPGAILKGPSAEGIVVGPDGGVVKGEAHGEILRAAPIPGGVINAKISPGVILKEIEQPIVHKQIVVPTIAVQKPVAVAWGGHDDLGHGKVLVGSAGVISWDDHHGGAGVVVSGPSGVVSTDWNQKGGLEGGNGGW